MDEEKLIRMSDEDIDLLFETEKDDPIFRLYFGVKMAESRNSGEKFYFRKSNLSRVAYIDCGNVGYFMRDPGFKGVKECLWSDGKF